MSEVCSLSYEEGFKWNRELTADMTPEEVRDLAAFKRKELAEFVQADKEAGMPWDEKRVAEISAQIDAFERMES